MSPGDKPNPGGTRALRLLEIGAEDLGRTILSDMGVHGSENGADRAVNLLVELVSRCSRPHSCVRAPKSRLAQKRELEATMGQRWIKIHLDTEDEDTEDEDYADVANLAWMMLRALPYNGAVEPDDKAQANLGALDARWSAYEREAQWSGQPTTP